MAKSKEQIKVELTNKSAIFKRFFNSADGEVILQALEDEFNGDNLLVPQDPYATHYNLGRRDVVVYIKQMLRYES